MIRKFQEDTALLLVDVQKGVNDTNYYGGTNGRRNNPSAEKNIIVPSWLKRNVCKKFFKPPRPLNLKNKNITLWYNTINSVDFEL